MFTDQNVLGLLCVPAPASVEITRANVHRETKGALGRASKSATQRCWHLAPTQLQQSHAFDLNLMPYIAADMYIVYCCA